jgi:hypothetical protein
VTTIPPIPTIGSLQATIAGLEADVVRLQNEKASLLVMNSNLLEKIQNDQTRAEWEAKLHR